VVGEAFGGGVHPHVVAGQCGTAERGCARGHQRVQDAELVENADAAALNQVR
jgi:hypothetical protein